MSLERRLEAMEKRTLVGRTLFVWEGDAEALVDAQSRAGPYDQIVTVGWRERQPNH